MKRADLSRDLDAVARSLVLAAAVIENLAFSLQSPQDGLDDEEARDIGPVPDRGSPGKVNAAVPRTAASPEELPAHPERPMDGTGLPPCSCPPCVTERAEGRRP